MTTINQSVDKKSTDKPSFSDFGEDFQQRIVQALLIDFSWAEQMSEIIKVEYFDLEHFQFLVKSYYNYYNKYRTFPTIPIILSIAKEKLENKTSYDEIILSRSVSLLKKIKNEPDLRDLPYVKERVLDFCKKQAMKEALSQSIEMIIANEYDQVIEVMKKALTVGEESSLGHDYDEDIEARFVDIQRDPIPTGILEMDKKDVLNGGLGRGELGVFCAAPAVGKSHFLVHLGAHARYSGYNVVHFSLEMREIDVGHRYDGWHTGYNNRDIPIRKNEVRELLSNDKNGKGRLFIKEYPSGYPSANTLRAYLQKIMTKKGFIPDLIIVDYADEMRAIKNFDSENSRHEFKAIYRDLRNLAREFNCALWTASQSNKEGSSAEIVTGENMSESFRKLDVPDVVFTGACRPQDKSKNILKGFVAKNRLGRDGDILPISIDKTTSRFYVISEDEYIKISRGSSEDKENEENSFKRKLYKKLEGDHQELNR